MVPVGEAPSTSGAAEPPRTTGGALLGKDIMDEAEYQKILRENPGLAGADLDKPPADAKRQSRSEQMASVFSELINKIAWSIGSAYGLPYSSLRSEVRRMAIEIAINVTKSSFAPPK